MTLFDAFWVGFALIWLAGIAALAAVNWRVHIEMTKQHSLKWGWGSFAAFTREFEKHRWEKSPRHADSFFDYATDSEIHAGIIRFDGAGMVLPLWDWWKFERWQKSSHAPTVEWQRTS